MNRSTLSELFQSLLQGDVQASIDIYEYVKAHPDEARYFVFPLREALSNVETRDYAAYALAEIGPAAASAVPELIKALNYDPENYVTAPFVLALGSIGKAAKDAVPALIDSLEVGDSNVDYLVAEALGNIGPVAYIAVPILEGLKMKSTDGKVREAASLAITKIRRT